MSRQNVVQLSPSLEQLTTEDRESIERSRKVLIDAAIRGDDLRWLDHPANWGFAYDVNRILSDVSGVFMDDIVDLRSRMIHRWAMEQAVIDHFNSLSAQLSDGSST